MSCTVFRLPEHVKNKVNHHKHDVSLLFEQGDTLFSTFKNEFRKGTQDGPIAMSMETAINAFEQIYKNSPIRPSQSSSTSDFHKENKQRRVFV